MASTKPVLRATDPPKRFDDAEALRSLPLEVAAGETHFLAVENGARTTTLVRNGRRRSPKDTRFVRRFGVVLGLLALFVSAPATHAQPLSPASAIERLFIADRIQAEWFVPEFLTQLPLSSMQQLIDGLKATYGAYQRVDVRGKLFVVTLARGTFPTTIALDPSGRIAGIVFGTVRARLSSVAEAVQMLRGFAGVTSFLVLESGRDRAALNADSPLAVGSVFKLAVLAALKDQIASGKRHWRDVVALRPEWKSMGSGVLHSWRDGSLLTLETLATLMISQSDNTAADVLIHTLGRETIEALGPRNRPFLTTREWALLKDPRNRDLLDRYRSGEEGTRRSVLPALAARPLPDPERYAEQGRAFDLEWYFTARELCSLITRVSDLPLMAINPGPAIPSDWGLVAYKGGSEPGVMNLTSYLRRRNGSTVCVAATWNSDQAIDERRLSELVGAVIDLLR